jgi:cell division protein FtsI/penicillin-binding protein 2
MARNKKARSRRAENILSIPEKANKILNLILIAMIVIVFRIWHLGVIQHEDKLEESRKPQRRTLVEPSKRATIRDRFNVPLAINKISYQAAILYSQLRQIPSVRWEKDPTGKKIKKFKRKEYIAQLAQILGDELNLDAARVEDLIHAKGSFYGQIPFVIKEDLSEKEYYRLKMLEKDWLGIHVQKVPKRYYPKERIGSDIIGYMGAINRQEYDKIMMEIRMLEDYIHASDAEDELILPPGIETLAQARQRFQDLEDHAYTINDYVGKAGIEASFESTLRGYHGKKSYYSDARGNFLRELPGSSDPMAGARILLTISAELQEYAERLLIQNDRIRETRLSKHLLQPTKQPWIKGGAIVAMDPQTGEVLALASFPRTDPNDFIPTANPDLARKKIANIIRWFESEAYIAEMWDQKRPLERERYEDETATYYEDSKPIDWNNYLAIVLKENSPLLQTIQEVHDVQSAVRIQDAVEKLMEIARTDNVYWLFRVLCGDDGSQMKRLKIPSDKKTEIENNIKSQPELLAKQKKVLEPYFANLPLHYDKILLIDLCRLAVCNARFTNTLMGEVGKQTLADYRDASAAYIQLQEAVQKMSKELFHDLDFVAWRSQNEKAFLKDKRAEEKAHHQYPKPYLDYFDKQEHEMFRTFWQQNQWDLLLAFLTGQTQETSPEDLSPYIQHLLIWHAEIESGAHTALPWIRAYDTLQGRLKEIQGDLIKDYLRTFRGFHDLNRPLLGFYRSLRKQEGNQLEKHLAAAFYPVQGYGYGRSQAYRQAATQGSIFKLVTAYETLKQRYNKLNGQNISLSNLNPLTMVDQIFKRGQETCVGYHEDGRPIPQHYNGGRMLKSHASNLGKLDILKALETSSNPYFSLLASDVLETPNDLADAAREFCYGQRTGLSLPWEIPGKVPDDLEKNRTGLYAMANGQHTLVVTPIQTSVMLSTLANGGRVLKPNIVSLTAGRRPGNFSTEESSQIIRKMVPQTVRQIFMPEIIRNILLIGMRKVVLKQLSEGLPSLSRFYKDYPEAIADYLEVKDEIVGKTSTSESMENIDLDFHEGTNLYTHVWFGGIDFDQEIPSNTQTLLYLDRWGNPELVVVVYLKYGAWGKESAPVGAQIIKKWREIKAKKQAEE